MENGIVKRVIGPVVDVQFPAGKLPEINNAIEVHTGERRIVMEAVQQLGDQYGALHLALFHRRTAARLPRRRHRHERENARR